MSLTRVRVAVLAVVAAAAVSLAAIFSTLGVSASGRVDRLVTVLHVSGNRILDHSGQAVGFQGVNRSGTEYACIQGFGIFDGPSDAQSVRAIAGWHVNIVRIPLNEDCWLGINGVKAQYDGVRYRRAIVNYVNLLHRYGMYAEPALMWGAPGTAKATYQPTAPDEDHSPAMWASMAATFKGDPNVILAPWGETTVSEGCFDHGCRDEASFGIGPWDGDSTCGTNCFHYTSAGMQQAVTVMRRAGYRGIISIPGVDYANDLSQWLSHEPRDPLHQLIAEAHVYGGNTCDASKCFNATYAPVARRVPLIFGEMGESFGSGACATAHIPQIVGWADAHHVGYEAWAWDAWGNCGGLIKNYSGVPYSPYGAWIKAHYAQRTPRLLTR